MRGIEFDLPPGVEFVDIAKTFTAYLRGSSVFNDRDKEDNPPFRKETRDYWQLDACNDYFFEIRNPQKGEIRCRYKYKKAVIKTMVELFKLRYHMPQ